MLNLVRKSKVLSFVLVLAMVLSMASVSFATDLVQNPNLVCWSPYTATVTNGGTVNLQVVPASPTYNPVGFDTAAEAAAAPINWSMAFGGDKISIVSGSTTAAAITIGNQTKYAQQITVQAAATGVGPASVAATLNNGYTNFTVVIPASAQTQATGVKASVSGTDAVNLSYSVDVEATGLTVSSGAYNYATPAKVLDALKTSGAIYDFGMPSGYVQWIAQFNGQPVTWYTDQTATPWVYYGWQYRVYKKTGPNTYAMDPNSALIGADTYNLSNDDVVAWYYGDFATADNYFRYNFDPTF